MTRVETAIDYVKTLFRNNSGMFQIQSQILRPKSPGAKLGGGNFDTCAGLIYDPADCEIMNEQIPFMDQLWAFNQLKPGEYEKKLQYCIQFLLNAGKTAILNCLFGPTGVDTICIWVMEYTSIPI